MLSDMLLSWSLQTWLRQASQTYFPKSCHRPMCVRIDISSVAQWIDVEIRGSSWEREGSGLSNTGFIAGDSTKRLLGSVSSKSSSPRDGSTDCLVWSYICLMSSSDIDVGEMDTECRYPTKLFVPEPSAPMVMWPSGRNMMKLFCSLTFLPLHLHPCHHLHPLRRRSLHFRHLFLCQRPQAHLLPRLLAHLRHPRHPLPLGCRVCHDVDVIMKWVWHFDTLTLWHPVFNL